MFPNSYNKPTVLACVVVPALLNAVQANADIELEEIIVESRRVSESQQTVPVAVTALTDKTLIRQGVTSFEDMQKIVPSLQIVPDNVGVQQVKIRGSFTEQFTEPGVIVYLDEAPVDPRVLNYSFYDLERVEVLKGPQGTLFGKNSTGGALLMFSKKPEGEQEGYIKGRVGTYSERYLEGGYTLPVNETLSMRLSGKVEKRDGFIKSTTSNQEYSDRDNQALRLSVNWDVTEKINNYFQYNYVNIEQHASPFQVDPDTQALYPFLDAINAFNGAFGGLSRFASPAEPKDEQKTINNLPYHDEYKYDGFNNITSVDFGRFTLKNIFNYSEIEQLSSRTFDGLILPESFSNLPSPPFPPNTPTGYYPSAPFASPGFSSIAPEDIETIYEEIQIYGLAFDEKLDWRVGASYSESESNLDGLTAAGTLLVNASPFDTDAMQANVSETETNSKAIFFQGTLDLSDYIDDGVSFTVGFRKTWDERTQSKLDATYLNPTFAAIVSSPVFICNIDPLLSESDCIDSGSAKFNDYNYNISLDWQINRDMFAYITSRRGYKSGGFNTSTPPEFLSRFKYDPEVVEDVEIGFKADWSIGGVQLRTNLAVYEAQYEGIITGTRYTDANNRLFQLIVNKDFNGDSIDATMRGYELETTAIITDWLKVSAFIGEVDSEYDNYVTFTRSGLAPPSGPDVKGEPVANVIPKSYGANVQVNFPVREELGEVSMMLSYTGADHGETTATDDFYSRRDTVNFRADWEGVMGSSLNLALYGKNITKNIPYNFDTALPFSPGYIYSAPSQWGVELTYLIGQ